MPLRQAHRLFQVGILLFLFAALIGLGVPHFAVPRLALSTHLLGILQGIFLVVIGLLWPKLNLRPNVSRVLFWLLVYGCVAALAANFLGAAWGAGNSILTMAAGAAHGSAFQEGAIIILLRSAGASLIVALLTIFWGLRAIDSGRT